MTAAERTSERLVELRAGRLEIRLAESAAEIDAAQALRYRVFYDEMSAHPTPAMAAARRDFDKYDEVCDHLLAIDHALGEGADAVVATYRLIRRATAAEKGGFYTADEYDIGVLLDYPGEILELGRSCVARDHRDRVTMQMLWRGLATYILHHDIAIMFGCASLPGTDVAALALPLAYLRHNHLAPPELRPRALPARYVDMDLMAPAEIDARRALAMLPPLLKGYLRLGGKVGDGAVVDAQFNTTDVCIVVQTELVTGKYLRHYTRGGAAGGTGQEG